MSLDITRAVPKVWDCSFFMNIDRKYDGAVFDADQTLIDNQDLINAAFNNTFKVLTGHSVEPKDVALSSGGGVKERYKKLISAMTDQDNLIMRMIANIGEDEFLSHCQSLHLDFQRKNAQLAKLFPDTMDTLRFLKRGGVKLAIATNRPREGLFLLESVGLTDVIDVIIAGDDTPNLKPYPDSVLMALSNINIPPERAVVIGDTARDIEAGKRAGTATIGTLWGEDVWDLIETTPDHYVTRMRDLRPIFFPGLSFGDIARSISPRFRAPMR